MLLNDPTRYALALGLTLRLTTPGKILIHVNSRSATLDSDALTVMEAFKHPSTTLEASHYYETVARDPQHFKGLLDLTRRLIDQGFLHKDSTQQRLTSESNGFASTIEHARMLNDVTRTERLIAAIEAVVKPGDVVLDIGSGTGILAMAAARAGARRVFALEQGAMAPVAESLIAANGFSDRIEVIRSWSWDVELPELADVVIGEILGNDPLVEGILLAFQDARARLAKPEARYIPSQLRLVVHPVEVPLWLRRNLSFVPESLAEWRLHYGLDFSALLASLPSDGEYRMVCPEVISELILLGSAQELIVMSCEAPPWPVARATTSLTLEAGKTMSGLLLAWEAQLAEGIVLPAKPPLSSDCSWQLLIWLLPAGKEISGPASMDVEWSFSGQSSFRITNLSASNPGGELQESGRCRDVV